MIIENFENLDSARARFAQFEEGEIILQQTILRGAIDALEFLVKHRDCGATPEQMLEQLRAELMTLHEVANARGITVLSYSG